MKLKTAVLATSIFCFTLPVQLYAEQASSLAFSAGAFDAFDNDTAAELGLEYRFAPIASFYNLIPVIGITANSDGGYWAHTGVRYDFHLNDRWVLTPNFAASLYEDGGGKDLGHSLEFRSGIELAYKLDENSHLGLGLYHLSNAGLGDTNPGEESIIFSYSFSPETFK